MLNYQLSLFFVKCISSSPSVTLEIQEAPRGDVNVDDSKWHVVKCQRTPSLFVVVDLHASRDRSSDNFGLILVN